MGACMLTSTGRHTWLPTGNASAYARVHNNLADITAQLAWLAHSLGLQILVEQPLSSILFDYAPMRNVLTATGSTRIAIHLDGFGACSQKPLQLRGTAPWLEELRRLSQQRRKRAEPQEQLTVVHTSSSGRRSVTGKREALKASSSYPPAFGMAVGRLHAAALQVSRSSSEPTCAPIFAILDD